MTIDINNLSEEELRELNTRVVARLNLLVEARLRTAMLKFNVGDRVSFAPEQRGALFGVIIRCNRKSVTVITEAGEQWKVAPALLMPAPPGGGPSSKRHQGEGNVVPIRRE